MTLAEFLTARIADDHAMAKAAFGPGMALNWPELPPAVDVFVDQYGPIRVLREVEAKRAILARHDDQGFACCTWCHEDSPCPDLRDLAAIYGDHPDYDPAWKA
jgi:hypothetical protein